ncbi:MAG TPA: FAD-dependent oxidoreductase [Solirubrobacteraceae bacterium]|jgi:ferredoxin--NADP+ reductase|nr:FAD-dependent oxidoreductase [Solirubrobacteraceae bacterium]
MTDHPIRIAVIGSGPAGFYAAGHLLKESHGRFEVDMLERLPTPWGLVRSGVAPDHPKIKSVTRIYEKTAAHPRFRYFGNVTFGEHVGREDLLAHYHAVVYATGSPSDRPLGIPGEELPGSHAATDFVGWYNGHPDQCDLEIDLLSAERALVIGNGNVALDVARMLVLAPSELAPTDTADHALEVLADSRVREVVVVGRRGPAQAAFTNPELLELGELSEADVIVEQAELDRALAVPDPDAEANATSRRNVEILRDYASRAPKGHAKRIVLRFLLSPTALLADEQGRLGAVELVRNELVPAAGRSLRAQATDEHETIQAGLVFRAIGYRGIPLPGVPFDERSGVIPNEGGRILDPDTGQPVPGEYVVGWIKRGPSGVIGTNKKDAQETVDAMLADLLAAGEGPATKHAPEASDPAAVESMLRERQPELVTYAGWAEIDRHERALGEPAGRPRVKLTRIEEMLRVAASQSPSEESLEEVEAG